MMANILLICLVFMTISAAVRAHENDHEHGIELRKTACRNLGGRCIKKNRACPRDLTLETSPGKPNCKRRRRCCYPVPTTVDPVLEEVVCGLENLPSTRIVSGSDVKESRKYPWQVGIKNKKSPKNKFYCGGTFITKKHILTAAHCFYSDCQKDVPKELYVGYGNYKQNLATTIRVSNVKFHKDYKCATTENDIAILTLSEPVELISPICLPSDGSYDEESKGNIIGWGSIVGYNPLAPKPEDLPNVLQEAQLPIISNALCNPLIAGGIKSTQICTSTGKGWNGSPKGSGICQGDSGGPLLVSKTGSVKQYVQIGISSFGKGCAAKDNPDVFTRVSKFLKFIKDNTGSETLYYLD